jgi:hypothetical protein
MSSGPALLPEAKSTVTSHVIRKATTRHENLAWPVPAHQMEMFLREDL